MAPKAKAPPKRTEADVIAEYEQIRQEFDERAVAIKARLEKASQALLVTRLDYVAARDNRVFLEAKLLAEKMAAEEFAAATAATSNDTHQEAKQSKRIIKDNQFELSYATQTSQALEKELESYMAQLQDLENMRTTNVGQMEVEMDRLAQSTSAFVSKSHKLQRTLAAIEVTERLAQQQQQQHVEVAELRSPLQLTLLCGTDTTTAVDGSALNPRCVMNRVEDVLTRRCGFQVFSKLVPEPSIVSSIIVTPTTERDLQGEISETLWAVAQNFAAPTITPVVVIHCPSWIDVERNRVMLRFSNVSDEVGRFLAECGQIGRRELYDIGLDHVLSMLVSRSRNPNLMVLIDTWAAHGTAEAYPFALIFSKSVADTPYIFRYTTSGASVDAVHMQGGALQRVTRGVLLEEFVAIVAACSSPSQLDCHTVTAGLVTLMTSRHSALTVQPLLPAAAIGTPFAPLFLPVTKLKELHHHVLVQLKPFPSPAPLHFERRDPLPSDGLKLAAPSALKWKHLVDSSLSFRGSSDATRYPLRTHVTSDLLKLHVKKEANVPHAAFEVDIAVEDDTYHLRDAVEDDSVEWAQIMSRRLYSACVTLDEGYVMEQRLHQCASVPIAIGHENWAGSSFSINVSPPQGRDYKTSSNKLENEMWHIDGVRLGDEKILRVEVALVLDVKKGVQNGPVADTYERVTAALDPLLHSVKRKLQELLEQLDGARLQGALRVVYQVDVWRISQRDDDHFRAAISVGIVVHEREEPLRHVVHARRMLVKLLQRYPAKAGDAWIPCAEQTTLPQPPASVFRVAHLFHVLKSWRCAVHLHPDTPFHLQSPRCEYLGHLLRRIVVVHAGIGGPQGTIPLMRLVDVRSVHPDPEEVNASFGPHLLLNEVSEEHLASAVTAAWGEPSPDDVTQGAASASAPLVVTSPARSLAAAFSSKNVKTHKTLCVLCWCFPKPSSSAGGDAAKSLMPLYVHSVMQSFHSKLRPTGAAGDVACLVTCGYGYRAAPDNRRATGDAMDLVGLEASFMNALLLQTDDSSIGLRRLPLDELAPNKDEDTGDEPPVAPGEAPVDEDAPYAEDETYRPLPNACLIKKSVHAYNPIRSLFPLPVSFWHRVRDASQSRLAAVAEGSGGVSLVAAVLTRNGSAAVHTLTDALEPLEVDAVREGVDVIPPALRPHEIERFVQSMLATSTRGAEEPIAVLDL